MLIDMLIERKNGFLCASRRRRRNTGIRCIGVTCLRRWTSLLKQRRAFAAAEAFDAVAKSAFAAIDSIAESSAFDWPERERCRYSGLFAPARALFLLQITLYSLMPPMQLQIHKRPILTSMLVLQLCLSYCR